MVNIKSTHPPLLLYDTLVTGMHPPAPIFVIGCVRILAPLSVPMHDMFITPNLPYIASYVNVFPWKLKFLASDALGAKRMLIYQIWLIDGRMRSLSLP